MLLTCSSSRLGLFARMDSIENHPPASLPVPASAELIAAADATAGAAAAAVVSSAIFPEIGQTCAENTIFVWLGIGLSVTRIHVLDSRNLSQVGNEDIPGSPLPLLRERARARRDCGAEQRVHPACIT